MSIIYEPKTQEWTREEGVCNSNNHKSEITGLEYKQSIAQTNKDVWTPFFPDPENTITIEISLSMCKLLAKVSKIGFCKNHRPTLYREELQELENNIQDLIDKSGIVKWFIRLNEASPKDGILGCGPLLSAHDVMTSITTSIRAYKAFKSSIFLNKPEILYIIPWKDNWNDHAEFRVFIHEKKVTCLSQYVWSLNVGWNKSNLSIVAPRIIDYCNTHIIPKFSIVESFVVDVIVVINDNKISSIISEDQFHIEFVELNSFGYDLASGAALFHWLNDFDIMYGTGDQVVVRYVSE